MRNIAIDLTRKEEFPDCFPCPTPDTVCRVGEWGCLLTGLWISWLAWELLSLSGYVNLTVWHGERFFHVNIQHSAVQHSAVQYSTVQYSTLSRILFYREQGKRTYFRIFVNNTKNKICITGSPWLYKICNFLSTPQWWKRWS